MVDVGTANVAWAANLACKRAPGGRPPSREILRGDLALEFTHRPVAAQGFDFVEQALERRVDLHQFGKVRERQSFQQQARVQGLQFVGAGAGAGRRTDSDSGVTDSRISGRPIRCAAGSAAKTGVTASRICG